MFATTLKILLLIVFTYIAYSVSVAVYNITSHPLTKLPGPRLRAAFHFPFFYEIWTGEVVEKWHELHEKYGPIVRVSPNCVSFTGADAWRDIYGQSTNRKPFEKEPVVFVQSSDGVVDIGSATNTDHTRMRRLFGYGMSSNTLKRQESLIDGYIRTLVLRLHQKGNSGNMPIDLVRWFNFTTFDIIGELYFSQSFDALKNEDYNFWIANIFRGIKFTRIFRLLHAYPMIGWPLLKLAALFPAMETARKKHEGYTQDRTARRLNEPNADREDIMSHLMRHNDKHEMTRAELMKNSPLIITGGSETSATLLSGAMFYLLTNRLWLAKLQDEVRTFQYTDLTFASLGRSHVLNAVIREAFRMYPPVPTILPRTIPKEGAFIDGVWIPGTTTVGVAQYPANMSSRNFMHPEVFAPKRWMGDKKYANDKLAVVQPFSVGPKNCLGQPLAMAEIRAILARLIWHFDLELDSQSVSWNKQKTFILWEKNALLVRLIPRAV